MLNGKHLSILLAVSVLAAGVSIAAAQTEADRHTIVGHFALGVKAELNGLVTPVIIRLEGRGKANAQRSVLVDIGPLSGTGAKARVDLDACQRCGPAGNGFRGRGTAVVAVGARTYTFRLRVRGRLFRTSSGARMIGSFVSIRTNDCPERFRGRFAGPMIKPTADEASP